MGKGGTGGNALNGNGASGGTALNLECDVTE